jgi:hypothetical protein
MCNRQHALMPVLYHSASQALMLCMLAAASHMLQSNSRLQVAVAAAMLLIACLIHAAASRLAVMRFSAYVSKLQQPYSR